MENKKIIQVEEKVPFKLLVPLSIQHMFAMFGASVLGSVRIRTESGRCFIYERNRNIIVHPDYKRKSACYLGSSFAFLAPAGIVIEKWGYSYALGGFVASVLRMCPCFDHPQIRFQMDRR